MKEAVQERSKLVLEGLRVLEIGHFVAAPFCARLLGDLGADVIKVESHSGDPVRQWGELIDGRSAWWSMHGRNKRSITLDLKSKEGRQIVLDLVAHCDVVVENFRPGHINKLGLSPDEMRQVKSDLIISHISGYGQNGPFRDQAAFGLIGEAIGGLRYLTNHPPGTTDLPPVRVGVSIGDSIAGLYSAFGIMATLWQRDREQGDGIGRTVDVALTESVLSMMEGMLPEYGLLGKVKQPTGGAISTAAPTNAYPTKDEDWILIGANSEPLFAKLCKLMGQSELLDVPEYQGNNLRAQHAESLDKIIAGWTKQYEIKQMIAMLNAVDIPNSKVYTAADCANDAQYRERGMVREVEDIHFGKKVLHAGVVPHIPESPGSIRWCGPSIGEHTNEILTELLGMNAERINELRSEGVI